MWCGGIAMTSPAPLEGHTSVVVKSEPFIALSESTAPPLEHDVAPTMSSSSSSSESAHEDEVQHQEQQERKHAVPSDTQMEVDSAPAAPTAAASSSPAAAVGESISAQLPSVLAVATLQLSSLTTYMHLYPSHRWDDEYNNEAIPIDERKTSYELRGTQEAAAASAAHREQPYPVFMNTPEAVWNWQPDEAKPTRSQVAAAQSRSIITTANSPAAALDAFKSLEPPSPERDEAMAEGAASRPLSHNRTPPSRSSSPPPYDGLTAAAFIQCSRCQKWRTVAPDVDVMTLNPHLWSCDQNTWNLPLARCSAVEEQYDEGELWNGMPCKFTRLPEQESFYRKLVDLLRGEHSTEELDRFPQIRRKPVDLHLMYTSVIKLGGYDKVSASNQWKTIQSCLQIPEQHDSSLTLKKLYRKLLGEYEGRNWRNPRAGTNASGVSHVTRKSTSGAAALLAAAAQSIPSSDGVRRPGKRSAATAVSWRNGADDVGEDESALYGDGGGARKKQRRAMANELDADMNEPDDAYGSDIDMDSLSRSSTSGSLGQAVRNLKNNMESRLRQLEQRTTARLDLLEANLTRALTSGLASIRNELLSSGKKAAANGREHERKQELLAKGMNMLLAEKVKLGVAKGVVPRKGTSATAGSFSALPPSGTSPATARPSSRTSPSAKPPKLTATLSRFSDSDAMDESKDSRGDIDADDSAHTFSVTTFIPSPTLQLPGPSYPRSASWVRQKWSQVDAVCFDVDSTVSKEEGIDVLAEFLGKGAEVKALTNQAMNGQVLFQDALQARLDVMKPSQSSIDACLAAHPPTFTAGFLDFVSWLRSDALRRGGIPIYLVSGGFRSLIDPLRIALGLPSSHVFANRFLFAADGSYSSFDATEFTSRSGGKARALEHIAARDGTQCMAMIGDGMTDVEACPPAQLMIGFGGITVRPAVKEKAHCFITDWKEIPALWKEPMKRDLSSSPAPAAVSTA